MNAGPDRNDQDAELERLKRQYPRWRIWRGRQDAELERLRRQYPRWWIWRDRATGDYWAIPPSGHPIVRELISANDISELARRLAQAEGQHGP